MNSLSPGAPLPSLMRSLRRAGWGELTGREWQGVRSVLMAVVDHAADGSGVAQTTAYQIADSAGLSSRWTRRCLHVLEDLGIITWSRGGVAYGKPQPSLFTVIKRRIVELIREARPEKDARDLARRAETSERLRTLRSPFVKAPPRRFRRSVHAELDNSPRPYGEKPTGVSPPEQDSPPPQPRSDPAKRTQMLATVRAQIRRGLYR